MTSLSCSQNSAVLGSAGPQGNIQRDFPEAPVSGTWYPQALVNAFRGFDIDPTRGDVTANFNQDIGTPGCLESLGWSYVIGAPAPSGSIPFTDTVLHEIAHGLGFLTFTNRSTGELFGGFSDHYTQHLLDETPTPTLWPDLDNAGRAASAVDTGHLTWNGPNVSNVAGLLSQGRHPTSGRVRMYAPSTLVSGSSVSHFDTVLTPNELMEPSLRLPNRQRLTNHLMLDIGWTGLAAVSIDLTDGETSRQAGTATTYTLTLQNDGPADLTVVEAEVDNTVPGGLNGVTWSCLAAGNAACGAVNGSGSIDTTVTLPLGGSATFTVNGTIDPGFTGLLTNSASVTLPSNILNTVSSVASDDTTVVQATAAAVLVGGISGDTAEGGQSATFDVVLNTQPGDDVVVPLVSSDPGEGTLSTNSLTFTPGNWDTPQTVTVFGVNDDIDDGDIPYTVQTTATSSADGDYDGLDPANVSVTNLDDDTAGIIVSSLSGNTTEAGGTASFTVELTSEPLANVQIGISSSDDSEAGVSASSLTFTPGNWDSAQQVIVTGVNDDVDDGDVAFTIVTAASSSADPLYNGLESPDPGATNLDDDTAGFTVSDISGDTGEGGAVATFTVALNTRPTGNVSVALSSSNEEEGTVAPAALVFTPENWGTPLQATVTGVDDAVDDGDVAYAIETTASGSVDPVYAALNPQDVAVTNVDDDTAGITVSLISGATDEDGAAATFTVVLDSEPTADVTIALSSSNEDEGTVAPSALTFLPGSWNAPQQVTVTGVGDALNDGDVAYTVITGPASSADGVYDGLDPDDVEVLNLDTTPLPPEVFRDGFEAGPP